MIEIDGQIACPVAAQTFPHFELIRDSLYRGSRDTHKHEKPTQLLVRIKYDKTVELSLVKERDELGPA